MDTIKVCVNLNAKVNATGGLRLLLHLNFIFKKRAKPLALWETSYHNIHMHNANIACSKLVCAIQYMGYVSDPSVCRIVKIENEGE